MWAYNFAADDRLGIYLTNTLEEAERRVNTLFGPYRVIAEEANAAAQVKQQLPIMVVMGNPPYSGHSANRSWETRDGKRVPTFIGRLVRDYYWVDGRPLDEKNPKWLQDDYVKFIRWGQWRIEQTGAGILAFITNHGYLDNPTFRGMRRSLMNSFDEIYVYDLHGNSKKKERAPDGSPDKNVFDIQQGVAIGIFVRRPDRSGPARVFHADLYGSRERKYSVLGEEQVSTTGWTELTPTAPHYTFRPGDGALRAEYETGWKLTDAIPVNSAGIVTARDRLTMQWTRDAVLPVVSRFASLTVDDARATYRLGPDVRDWRISFAQADIAEHGVDAAFVRPVLYRPFDTRWTYYTGRTRGFICMPRPEVMAHMNVGPNVALVTTRQTREPWDALCTRSMAGHKSCAAYDINSLFPLYLYPRASDSSNGSLHSERSANLAPAFIDDISRRIGLTYVPDGTGDLQTTFGPEDVFHYIYAVLHSPAYRSRYAELLKGDFPRVQLTGELGLFRTMCSLGAELAALHLLESPLVSDHVIAYPLPGDDTVASGFPRYRPPGEPEPGTGVSLGEGRVYINPRQYFTPVGVDIWRFRIGGYQVCEKWLKDRRGRELAYEDQLHYKKVLVAIRETIRLMHEIDRAIPEWPIR